jgi:hypothetical protein
MNRFILVGLLLATSPVQAQLIVGGGPGGQLWNINPQNPAAAVPLPGSEGASPWGMTYDPASNSLYWIMTGNASYVVQRSSFGPSGLIPTVVGGGVIPGPGSFLGMAFDSSTGRLYAALSVGLTQTSIYEINTGTGAASFAATLPEGQFFTGFDYDASGDRFLATTGVTATPGAGLYELSFRTGTPSYTQIAPYPASELQIEGLAIGNGRAYLVNSDGPIFVLNLSTGFYEPFLTSPLAGSGFGVAGAAYVPAPAGAAGLLLLGAFRRRR